MWSSLLACECFGYLGGLVPRCLLNALVGGYCVYGLLCGALYLDLAALATWTNWYRGACSYKSAFVGGSSGMGRDCGLHDVNIYANINRSLFDFGAC